MLEDMTGLHSKNEMFTEHDILKEIDDVERKAKRINRRTKYSREEIDKIIAEITLKSKDDQKLNS